MATSSPTWPQSFLTPPALFKHCSEPSLTACGACGLATINFLIICALGSFYKVQWDQRWLAESLAALLLPSTPPQCLPPERAERDC